MSAFGGKADIGALFSIRFGSRTSYFQPRDSATMPFGVGRVDAALLTPVQNG